MDVDKMLKDKVIAAHQKANPGDANAAIDPVTVVTIITALLELIRGCRNPASAQSHMRRKSILAQGHTRRALRRAGYVGNTREMTDALLDQAANLSDEEMKAVLNEAGDVPVPPSASTGPWPFVMVMLLVLLTPALATAGPFPRSVQRAFNKIQTFPIAASSVHEIGPDRVIFVTAEWCPSCPQAKEKFEKARPALEKRGWTIGYTPDSMIQIVEYDQNKDWLSKLGVTSVPYFAKIENQRIVRSLEQGCSTPIDAWSIGWLAKGVDERPNKTSEKAVQSSSGQYPLRGAWWTVGKIPNASRAVVLDHLKNSPNHSNLRAELSKRGLQLDRMTRAELHSLHSDDHEGKLKLPEVTAKSATPCPATGCPTATVQASVPRPGLFGWIRFKR